jgi:ABC-type transport system involved in multi-copper enzyme maturation permease subunit
MKRLIATWGLPLLAKELSEQSARRRTYVVRTLYASLLFFAAYIIFHNTLRVVGTSSLAVLGQGREMFEVLVGLQFAGIYLFAPALTCGVITHEKERASLQLLFLTRLGPWTILFEKFLSRLIPIFGFLMLSLPLLAFAYMLGGITPYRLAGGVWFLFATALQAAAIGLACSAYFRTTAASFVATYLFLGGLLFGPALMCELWGQRSYVPDEFRFAFFAPALFFGPRGGFVGTTGWTLLLAAILQSIPILFSAGAAILMSRLFIVRRAFAPPRNIVLNLFRHADQFFQRWNENSWTKGIVLIPDKGSLPDSDPVAWRETSKRSLGRARYLIRLFLLLEVPLLVLCLMLAITGVDRYSSTGTTLIFFLWGIAVLLVAVQAASLVAREKSHQTLEVLCTTPLSSREIIRQKFRGVRRLILVMLIPFFTLILFQAWWQSMNHSWDWRYSRGESYNGFLYLFSSGITVGIYLPMVAWMSLWIGLHAKSQGRAIIGSLAAIVGWCILPFLCCIAPLAIGSRGGGDEGFLLLTHLSPLMQVLVNEFGSPGPRHYHQPSMFMLNSVGYGAVLLLFRWICLNNAGALLGRGTALEVEEQPAQTPLQKIWSDRIFNSEETG